MPDAIEQERDSRSVRSAADRTKHRAVLTFFAAAVTVGGCMFCFKLFSFLKTIKKDELAGFAYDPSSSTTWSPWASCSSWAGPS